MILSSVGGRKLEDVEHILEKCSDLIQAVNTDKHHKLMRQTFDAIMVILVYLYAFRYTLQL